MNRRETKLDAAHKWAAKRHTRISSFALFRPAPGGTYIEAEFASLAEAQTEARQRTKSPGGRKLSICAMTPEGWVFRLEDVTSG